MERKAILSDIQKDLDIGYVELQLQLKMGKLPFLRVEKDRNGKNIYWLNVDNYQEYLIQYQKKKIEILEQKRKIESLIKTK